MRVPRVRNSLVIARLESQLAAEQKRVETLLQVLLRKEAPAATYEYLAPETEHVGFPANATVSDDGLTYFDPDSGETFFNG